MRARYSTRSTGIGAGAESPTSCITTKGVRGFDFMITMGVLLGSLRTGLEDRRSPQIEMIANFYINTVQIHSLK
jgi:hypothetical protein